MSQPIDSEKNAEQRAHSDTITQGSGSQVHLGQARLTPAQYEQVYLQPGPGTLEQQKQTNKYGNPSALGLACFCLTFTPTMLVLMGLRGTNSTSLLGLLGPYYLMGGLGLWVAGILEWIVGNSYSCLIFGTFGSFYLSFGITLDPNYGLQSTLGTNGPLLNSTLGFYLIVWAVFVYFLSIGALVTNFVNLVVVFFVGLCFNVLGCSYLALADGRAASAARLQVASGALGFVASIAGLYSLLHLILAAVDFPFNVPLGDLSRFWPKKKAS